MKDYYVFITQDVGDPTDLVEIRCLVLKGMYCFYDGNFTYEPYARGANMKQKYTFREIVSFHREGQVWLEVK